MSTNQKSVSIDAEQQKNILKYMEMNGIKSFSGGIYALIDRGLKCRCSTGNNGGGVLTKQNVSSGTHKPQCFGKPGEGNCGGCNIKVGCASAFASDPDRRE